MRISPASEQAAETRNLEELAFTAKGGFQALVSVLMIYCPNDSQLLPTSGRELQQLIVASNLCDWSGPNSLEVGPDIYSSHGVLHV